jgi:Domain of unknown function (DUF4340)
MNKNIILLAILALLGGFIYWQYSRNSKDTFADNEHTQFAVQDVQQIGRIFIAERNNNAILLEKKSDEWTFTNKNTGKSYPANLVAINTLLQTIQNIRSRSPVAKAAIPNVVNQLAAKGRKVEIYDTRNNLIRTYYVGGPANSGEGTFMIMEKSETPYIVYYPNWVGSLDTRYNTDETTWRDRYIFNVKPENLDWVEIDYQANEQRQHSFRIKANGDQTFNVNSLSNAGQKQAVNPQNALQFIKSFDFVGAEAFILEKKLIDSINQIPPFAKVSYQCKGEAQAKNFIIYPIKMLVSEKPRDQVARYFVKNDQDDYFLAQHSLMNKILWSYDFFFQQANVVINNTDAITSPLPQR